MALFKKPSEPSDYVAMTDSASENGTADCVARRGQQQSDGKAGVQLSLAT